MLELVLKGMIIGVGAIAPSVSGGSLAVSFGIYDKLIDAFTNIFSNPKKSLNFLLPLGLGAILGIILFGNTLLYLFENYEIQTLFAFIGVILASLPSVFKKATKGKFKNSYLMIFIIAFGFILLIDSFAPQESAGSIGTLDSFEGVISGIILGLGTVIPGVSSSVILMALGYYPSMLYMVSKLDIIGLIPVGISFLLTIIVTFKLVEYLFKNYYSQTYYGILGFTIGSMLSIVPGLKLSSEYIVGYGLLILFFILTTILNKKFSDSED